MTTPAVIGAAINVANSDDLASLDLYGLTVGTKVWNIGVGSYFQLTSMPRTSITLTTTDSYDSPTWTLANATFTGHEGDTLVIVLSAPNVEFSRAYVIDTVGSATTCNVVDPPDGQTSGETFGSAVLYDDALVTDSVVSANGVIGLRWVKETPPGIQGWTKIGPLEAAAQTLTISGLDGDADGVYEFVANVTNGHAGNAVLTAKPNNVATQQETIETTSVTAGTVAVAQPVGLLFGRMTAGGGNNGSCISKFSIIPTTGTTRAIIGTYDDIVGAFTSYSRSDFNGVWSETAANITSIVLSSDVSDGFGIGTYILWRKVPVA